jgi:predicted transcriptional regulator
MSIGEICNREVIICNSDDSIMEAVKLMRDQHVGDVVVVERRSEGVFPLGILTDRDVVIELLAEEVDLNSVACGDVMSREMVTAVEEDEILPTIEHMRDKGIRRIPVVNRQGELQGILSFDDLVELISEQLTDLVRLVGREVEHEKAIR